MKQILKYSAILTIALSCFASLHADHHQSDSKDKLRAVPVQDLIGLDLYSKDGKKIGDAVDFVLEFNNENRLTHVVVMTGGLLNMGGDQRLIPSHALERKDGRTYEISLTYSDFMDLKTVEDVEGFLQSGNAVNALARKFGVKSVPLEAKHVELSSDMQYADVYAEDGTEMGFITSSYISLEEGTVPYIQVEIMDILGSPVSPTTTQDIAYAIPASDILSASDVDVTINTSSTAISNASEPEEAESISVREMEIGKVYMMGTS